MKSRGDAATPLWLTELAWGSAPPDGFGLNKGPTGQAQMLTGSYNMILRNRTAWNVERLFWYHWRDPDRRCGVVQLLRQRGPVALQPHPEARLRQVQELRGRNGPARGDASPGGPEVSPRTPTPTFTFTSNEPGSTFVCKIDGGAYKPCSSPYTTPPLANGNHALFVRAIDAPGNDSQFVWRGFKVDTQPPARPQITDTDPNSPANDNAPELKGTAEAGSTVKLYKTAGCTGPPAALGSAGKFASPGITASVPDNTTTAFRATATDAAGNVSACSGPFTYVEDSTP